MAREADQGRLLLHLDIRNHVVHGRVFVMGLRQRAMVESGRRVSELVRSEGLGMLGLETKGIDILELVLCCDSVRVEAMKVWCWRSLASMDPSFRGG